ncbi:MAG: ascorbate-dependent monooxygenase, partial [Singulisphaera sp.]
GKPETDATSIGLYFAKGPVDKLVRGGAVFPPRERLRLRPSLLIPAGAANHEVTGTWTVPFDAHLVAVAPHMHWLGRDFSLEATRPDGSASTLIRIDRWDFNWQGTYDLSTPLALPEGTRIDMRALRQLGGEPVQPERAAEDVRWGEQTTDEMCIGSCN